MRRSVTDQQIIEQYELQHSIFAVAKALGVGASTAHRVLRKNGVPLVGLSVWRRKATRFRGEESQIRDAYERGATYEELRQRFGEASDHAFKHAIKRAGGALRQNPASRVTAEEVEKMLQLYAAGTSQMNISIALNRSQPTVARALRSQGIVSENKSGDQHSMWKGGRFKKEGYWHARVEKDDPVAQTMRDGKGYVPEHRLIMARALNRPLTTRETVHHINGDRGDNRIENLQLRHGKHGKHEVMCCLDCGSRNIGALALD